MWYYPGGQDERSAAPELRSEPYSYFGDVLIHDVYVACPRVAQFLQPKADPSQHDVMTQVRTTRTRLARVPLHELEMVPRKRAGYFIADESDEEREVVMIPHERTGYAFTDKDVQLPGFRQHYNVPMVLDIKADRATWHSLLTELISHGCL